MIPDEIAKWKIQNPLFRYKLSKGEWLNLLGDNVSTQQELIFLQNATEDLSALMQDIQVNGFDLIPNLMLYLMKKRNEVLKA